MTVNYSAAAVRVSATSRGCVFGSLPMHVPAAVISLAREVRGLDAQWVGRTRIADRPFSLTVGLSTDELQEARKGFQNFVDAGFVDTFRMFTQGNGYYTWWVPWGGAREKNLGWRIDYFLVSSSLKPHVAAAQIHPDVMGSDHCPVSLELAI